MSNDAPFSPAVAIPPIKVDDDPDLSFLAAEPSVKTQSDTGTVPTVTIAGARLSTSLVPRSRWHSVVSRGMWLALELSGWPSTMHS